MEEQLRKMLDEAARDFAAWRERNDPNHELPMQEAAWRYATEKS